MKVFRDLFISADAETMAAAVAEMERHLPEGWIRDQAAEARGQAFAPAAQRLAYCFTCKREQRRHSALLTLAQQDHRTFYVSNIVPSEAPRLDKAEYNHVLEDFFQHVFRPAADRLNLRYTLTEAEAGLENWMDEPTAELLRAFSATANKWTAASHPADRERWNAFLVAAHRTKSRLKSSTLVQWLVEDEEWPQEIAEQLALEYESARGVLAYASIH